MFYSYNCTARICCTDEQLQVVKCALIKGGLDDTLCIHVCSYDMHAVQEAIRRLHMN